jgi:hypothetical protein
MQAKSNRYSRQPSKNENLRDSSRPLTISLDFLLLFEALFCMEGCQTPALTCAWCNALG